MHKILVVDDMREVRNLIRLSLPFDEFQTMEAENGKDALSLARDWQPDLVLLDILMPGDLDGFQVCREIKQGRLHPAPLVILLTALGSKNDIDNGHSAGADAYVVKPFSPSELANTIRHLLSTRNPGRPSE